MSQFVGKWKGNKASRKNFEEYCKMTGVPEDLVEKYRNATTTVEYENKDENWTMTVISDAIPAPRVFKFKLGEECVSQDAQGQGIKFTAVINSDGSMVDSSSFERMGWKPTTTTRKVYGNKMNVETKTGDATMSYEMDKV
ncbi:gastrotropin-like [Mytilus galloprovincialis]|uniref:gastrotropin-like n=1 Tax=Mytilus galloprovincialis TaxID=29158 RepID=UPI003F7B9793